MLNTFEKVKETVLNFYADFLPLVLEIKQNKKTSYDISLKALDAQAKNMKENKFLLMVVGEAKSGKSTFINAYLGEEILPMDVKQCTSAIVEIRYGEQMQLTVTYSDNRKETITKEKNIKAFIAANAALDDNYRDIPVSVINLELLVRKKGKNIHESEIQDLLKGIENENLYHLTKKEYEAKVRRYIKEKHPLWKNIVKKIEIRYPFSDNAMKGIEIVDSPGVNVEGRVGDITNEYIEKANAVMFLKPITGAALEASSFKKFLNSKSADRNRNAMFLILTRAANETPENIKRIHEEALRQFPAINSKQIIPVDSKVKLFIHRIQHYTNEELQLYLIEEMKAGRLDSFLFVHWFISQNKKQQYISNLMELSNFAVIDEALNLFAHKAQYIALSELLTRMLGITDKILDELEENIGYYNQKALDPEKLAQKMTGVKKRLEELTQKINCTVDEVAEKYNQRDGIIEQRANKVYEEYRQEIDQLNPRKDTSLDELEKISFRKIEILKGFEKELQKKMISDCDQALIKLSNKSTIKYSTIQPDLTKDMIDGIKADLKEKAIETKTKTIGSSFNKRTEHFTVFSQAKYYGLFKNEIDEKIEAIKNDAVDDLKEFIRNTASAYRKELSVNASLKRNELNAIVQAKQTAEEIQKTIATLNSYFKKLEPLSLNMKELKKEVDKNIG